MRSDSKRIQEHEDSLNNRPNRPFIGLLLVACIAASPLGAGPWQGEEVESGGIVRVMNPADPAEPKIMVEPEELWRLGGDTESDDEFFGVIGAVEVDQDGNVFLLDRQLAEVKVFDSQGAYIRTIGREGEGPGEFRGPIEMFMTTEGNVGVLQMMPGKIVMLTPEGDPAGEFRLPEPEGGGNRMLWGGARAGKKIVVGSSSMSMQAAKAVRASVLASYTADGEEATRYFEDSIDLNFGMLEIDERDGFRPIWDAGQDGSIYAVTTFGEYEIQKFRPDGTLDRVVERDYSHLKRSAAEIEAAKSRIVIRGPAVEPKITVSEHHPDVVRIYARDDGTIWVLSSRGVRGIAEGSIAVFDVFDSRGRFIRQIELVGEGDPVEDAYFLVGDRLYVVTGFVQAIRSMHAMDDRSERETEDDGDLKPMEVICYSLEGVPVD